MNRRRSLAVALGVVAPLLLSGSFVQSPSAEPGNLCNPGWYTQLESDPSTPAPYGNNVDTGYAEFFFVQDPRIKLVLKGSFPMVRFVSFQTYTSLRFAVAGALFDYQVTMDPGSLNPYVPGAAVDRSPRAYTITILPPAAPASSPNVLRMGDDPLQQFIVRFYSPDAGVALQPADLPKVYAYYWASGLPAPCPSFLSVPFPHELSPGLPAPQPGTGVTFVPFSDIGMVNSAVPFYWSSYNHMALGEVAVIRFRAPSFVNTHSGSGTFPDPGALDMRYWSLSGLDPTTWVTFGGLPDWMALPPDANGYVTVVVSRSPVVQAHAATRGHNFILDQRSPAVDPGTESVIFAYRNLLPSPSFMPDFTDSSTYPAAYVPTGLICSEDAYLQNLCDPPA